MLYTDLGVGSDINGIRYIQRNSLSLETIKTVTVKLK